MTFILYECEEIESAYNGLGLLAESDPDLLQADFAILMEPSDAVVEAGCQGTMRVDVTTYGERAHCARSWKGVNAIHRATPILRAAHGVRRAQAGDRRPDLPRGPERGRHHAAASPATSCPTCAPSSVNYRFAPDRSEAEAEAFVRDFFEGYDVRVSDSAPGALPGLDRPAAKEFVEAVGGTVNPKFGWTDVSRFSALGVPAVNFGPGDPMLAHKQEEFVPLDQIRALRTRPGFAGWEARDDREVQGPGA